ncbi:hypothetical protein [Streptomyces sp. NPDC058434]|uniref:hypothetical protein n=1 Tax=Streptomyces sp. NPDC058434 TaxID=3346498 RepID=UPI00365069D5
MTHVLLPLDVFHVSYELAVGRPFSKLEELLLRLIAEDQGEEGRVFQELREAFQVHDRLLVEGLVTLLREGWVAMVQSDPDIRYVATVEGLVTIDKGRRPAGLRVQRRHAKIVRETLSCQVEHINNLEVFTAEEIRRKTGRMAIGFALRRRQHRRTLNGGETEWLLPRSSGEQQWIRRIDSDARVLRGKYFLPLRVDLEERTVRGLPGNWGQLIPLVLDQTEQQFPDLAVGSEAQRRFGSLLKERGGYRGRGQHTAGRDVPQPEPAAVPCAEAALRAWESRQLAERALERASGRVLIAASHLDDAQAKRLSEVVTGLRGRGVSVDVLWSCADVSGSAHRRLVDALDSARGRSATGKLFYNRTPAEAKGDFVLADTGDGPVAVLGAGLLSGPAQDQALCPAVLVDDVRGLSTLALLASGWWQESPDDHTELAASRWRRLAEKWVEEAALNLVGLGTEQPEDSPDSVQPLLPSPRGGAEASEVSLLIGAQGAATIDRLLDHGACTTDHLPDTWDPVGVAATAREWVVYVRGTWLSTLSFRLRGRLAAELWERAGIGRDRVGEADRLPS